MRQYRSRGAAKVPGACVAIPLLARVDILADIAVAFTVTERGG